MSSRVGSILSRAHREDGPYNIGYVPMGTRYEKMLLECGHTFFPLQNIEELPIDLDILVSQSRLQQLASILTIGRNYSIPVLSIDSDFPHPDQVNQVAQLDPAVNLFASTLSQQAWRLFDNVEVIPESISIPTFPDLPKEFVSFDWWPNQQSQFTQQVVPELQKQFPVSIIDGSSEESILQSFARTKVYVNIYHYPGTLYSILMAMAAGCVVVSVTTPVVQECVLNKVTGFLADDVDSFLTTVRASMIEDRSGTVKLAKSIVSSKFSKETFNKKFDAIFKKTAEAPYWSER